MDVTPLIRHGQQVIQKYTGGEFRVSGVSYTAAIIVTPEETFSWDAPADFTALAESHFEHLPDADVILLGTGKTMHFLPPELRKTLKNRGVHVDTMDTGAACRTYNVLMAEGRRVAALLLPYI